ncbi:MAG: hypothetical protein ABIJ86_03725, partial [Spirochaetota bacterium]
TIEFHAPCANQRFCGTLPLRIQSLPRLLNFCSRFLGLLHPDNDGHNSNFSFNHGKEGPSRSPAIETLRARQARNILATLLLSIGTPMILGGDEFGRTQKGNNNAYCQNNEISWSDWRLVKKNTGLFRFTKELIAFRKAHPAFHRPEFFTGKDSNYNALPDIEWFSPEGGPPDWARIDKVIAARLDGSRADIVADRDDNDFFLMVNAGTKVVHFRVCHPQTGWRWCRVIDTSLEAPQDIVGHGDEPAIRPQDSYVVGPRSLVLLLSRIS